MFPPIHLPLAFLFPSVEISCRSPQPKNLNPSHLARPQVFGTFPSMALESVSPFFFPTVNPQSPPMRRMCSASLLDFCVSCPVPTHIPCYIATARLYCNAFIFHLVYKPPQGSWARPVPGPAPPAPTPTAPPAPARRRRGEKKPGRRARRRR